MNGVRRRGVRSHSRRKIALLLLLCLCITAGIVLYLIFRPRTYPDLPRAEDPTTTFSSRDVLEISRLTIRCSSGEEYVIVRENDAWSMEGMPDFVFSSTMLNDALENAAVVITEKTVLDLSDTPELSETDFGITDSSIRVRADYTDGESLTFMLGSLLPEETPAYYFMVENDSRVFAVSQDVHDTYSRSRMTLHAVADPALNASLIDRITFSGENAFTIENRTEGWYMTAPFEYPLSSAQVDTLLGKLEGLRFAAYVENAQSADLAAYGLNHPRRTVTLDIAPSIVTGYDENGSVIAQTALDAYQLTFVCGQDANDVSFYCLYRGDIVKATHFSSGVLLTQTYTDLLSTAPINIPTNLLSQLSWDKEGETRVYDVTLVERLLENNEFETDARGNILCDVVVTCAGDSVDSDSFLLGYQQLAALRTTKSLPDGYQPSENARQVITLRFEDAERRIAFYPLDALHDAVSVNGVFLYYVDASWADGISLP